MIICESESPAYMFILPLAMIADRVMLLPGTRVGKQTVMGSGAQGRRNTIYEDGSTWMGNGVYAALQAIV